MPISMPTKFMAVSAILSKLNKCSEKGGLVPPFFISLQGIFFPFPRYLFPTFLFSFSLLSLSSLSFLAFFRFLVPFAAAFPFPASPFLFSAPVYFPLSFFSAHALPPLLALFFPSLSFIPFCCSFSFLISKFRFLYRVGYSSFLLLLDQK